MAERSGVSASAIRDWNALAERLRAEAQSRIDRLSQVLRELAPPAPPVR
ncbi:hypothetical protein [Micromonospora sp. AP08]|nr:hypothetical protein [Micromonospora sp. AP08]